MAVPAHAQLDPGPFREWCKERLMPGTREWSSEIGALAGRLTAEQLAEQMGVDARRLYAWRHENVVLDREHIEDALHRVGYVIEDIYPDLPPLPAVRRGGVPAGYGSFLTDDQVLSLHKLHVEGVSIAELARRIYRKAGYRSAGAASYGIRSGFRRLGLSAEWRPPHRLKIRPPFCAETTSDGKRCEGFAMADSDRCWSHRFPEQARQNAKRHLLEVA